MGMRVHPIVDVHIHYLPRALLSTLLGRDRFPRAERRGGSLVLEFGNGYVEHVGEHLAEPEGLRESLRLAGVDIAVVSINQPGVLLLPPIEAAAVARDANDELLQLVRDSDGAIEGLATLPWQVTDAAVDELERAASMGLKGAMVCSNIAGAPLDAPAFDPTFEAAAARSMPLLLHPTLPADVSTLSEHGLICAAGFLFDTTTAVLRMMFAGTMDRHPTLRILLAHAGSLLPLLAGRIEREHARGALPVALPAERRPADYLRRLYTDTIAGSPKALELAIDLVGADHVCFGSDFPFNNQAQALDLALSAAGGDDNLRTAVCGRNACALFDLEVGA
jgi:aminocarboxymuconate-semialdehyde decarboxylase